MREAEHGHDLRRIFIRIGRLNCWQEVCEKFFADKNYDRAAPVLHQLDSEGTLFGYRETERT